MANYINITDTVLDTALLDADREAAEVFWRLRIGKTCVYFPKLLKTAYIPIAELSRVFIRVESVISKVCCGPAEFNIYRLIFCKDDREIAQLEMDSEVKVSRALAALAKRGVTTGKPAAQ